MARSPAQQHLVVDVDGAWPRLDVRLTGTASCPEGRHGAEKTKAAGRETATTLEINMLTTVLFNFVCSLLDSTVRERDGGKHLRKENGGGGGGWSEDSNGV